MGHFAFCHKWWRDIISVLACISESWDQTPLWGWGGICGSATATFECDDDDDNFGYDGDDDDEEEEEEEEEKEQGDNYNDYDDGGEVIYVGQ